MVGAVSVDSLGVERERAIWRACASLARSDASNVRARLCEMRSHAIVLAAWVARKAAIRPVSIPAIVRRSQKAVGGMPR